MTPAYRNAKSGDSKIHLLQFVPPALSIATRATVEGRASAATLSQIIEFNRTATTATSA